jgi:cytochrome P450 family 135
MATLPPHLPGPQPFQTAAWLLRPIETLGWMHQRYGDLFTIDLGRFGKFVFVSDPALIAQVFKAKPTQLHAGEPNRVLSPMIGTDNVLANDEDRHLRQRKMVLPPFHGKMLQTWAPTFERVALESLDAWPVGEPFQLRRPMQRVSLEVIVELIFGVQDPVRKERLCELLPRALDSGEKLLFSEWLLKDLGPLSPGGRFARLRARVDELVYAEIAERRRADDLEERTDVLSMLLVARDEDGEPLSDLELRDQLMTLLVAGHETTATSLAWAFDLLLHHPAVLSRVRAEIAEGGTEYLDAVIKEVMRLRPTVINVVRKVKEPYQLGPYLLPAGTVITPSIQLVHRRPDLYPEPEAFRPERWLGDHAPESYSWLPFGGGIRRCIGASFALLEIRTILQTILPRVELRAAEAKPERPVRRTVTIVPRHGTRVVLERRLVPEPSPPAERDAVTA